MRKITALFTTLCLATAIPALKPATAAPATAPAADWQAACTRLVGPTYPADDGVAKVTGAVPVPESVPDAATGRAYATRGKAQAIPTAATAAVPAHCRVEAYATPNIRFEMRLPAAGWNRRLLMVACDGFCGFIFHEACVPGLARDYVIVTSDGGHTAMRDFDGAWGYNNPQAQVDFGYRANHVVAVAAKAIIQAYYGTAPDFSYITGCSKGGQAGIMAAIRYPADFDGVIAGAPVLDYQGKNAYQFPWVARAMTRPDGSPMLTMAELPLLEQAVLDRCDGIDGSVDGIIADPRRCDFDPKSLLCPAGQTENCLDGAQVAALEKVYDTPRDSKGRMVYPAGTIVGSEGNWPHWLVPTEDDPVTFSQRGAEEYLRYLAFETDPGPTYDAAGFSLDDAAPKLEKLSPVYDALNPDLSAFRDRGGRIILWHGWGDAAISPLMTIRYYREMAARMGGEAAATGFARLFLLPGVHHCRGGRGPGQLDALSALEAWRERGIAPDLLRATGEDGRSLDIAAFRSKAGPP